MPSLRIFHASKKSGKQQLYEISTILKWAVVLWPCKQCAGCPHPVQLRLLAGLTSWAQPQGTAFSQLTPSIARNLALISFQKEARNWSSYLWFLKECKATEWEEKRKNKEKQHLGIVRKLLRGSTNNVPIIFFPLVQSSDWGRKDGRVKCHQCS